MKTLISTLVLLILAGSVAAQSTDRKTEKEKRKVERERSVLQLVESKTFDFRANRAIPTGYKSVDLVTNPNFVKFNPDSIWSEMPFFGRAYSIPYGGDGGLKFKGKPEVFTVEKKKKYYLVEAKVKGTDDFYSINLSVGFEGGTIMTISSNNRSTISYNGEIFAPEKSEEKK